MSSTLAGTLRAIARRLSVGRRRSPTSLDPAPQPAAEDCLRPRASLARLLLSNILPFWIPRILDEESGGYHLNHDSQGRFRGAAPKALVGQARTTWFFSRLAQTPYGESSHLELAAHGYAFLRDRLWDATHGGFFWEVEASGRTPTRPDKHLYGQAFGLYALAEFARAASDPPALALAHRHFLTFDRHAHDGAYGGYCEFFRRDWTAVPAGETNYLGLFSGIKSLNTHLHLAEALTEYLRVSQDSFARERLLELLIVLSNSVVRKTVGVCTDRHQRDWTPVDWEEDPVSYGHDLENVWLLWEGCDAAGMPNGPLLDLYRVLFLNAWRFAFDREDGGFFDGGRPGRAADARGKSWWVQAEAMVCALLMHRITGEAPYYQCFSRTLDWIMRRQADWEHGDWHAEIGADGTPRGDKASAWKAPYHNGRAVLRCLELLEPLIESAPATALRTPPS